MWKLNKNVAQHWLVVIVASSVLPNFLRKSESIRIFGLASNKKPQQQLAKDRCSSVLLERINLKPLLFRLLKIFAEILYADIFRTLRSELHNVEFCRTLRTEI